MKNLKKFNGKEVKNANALKGGNLGLFVSDSNGSQVSRTQSVRVTN